MDRTERYIVNDLGEEVTGIALPVTICMILTIALVRILNANGASDGNAVLFAEAIYTEQEGDSNGKKFEGSVLNTLVFVAIVTLMTFVIVLLFKYGCVKFIYAYLAFATFLIFFFLTGGVVIALLQKANLHVDMFSLLFLLYNFAAVGSVALFLMTSPLAMKQMYLTWTGAIVAYIFTYIPPWTTWVLLAAMALYDIVAVLTPNGPLQMLVNLAIERQEEIPALVYQAREVRRGPRPPSTTGGDVVGGMDDVVGDRTRAPGPVGEALDEASLDAEPSPDLAGHRTLKDLTPSFILNYEPANSTLAAPKQRQAPAKAARPGKQGFSVAKGSESRRKLLPDLELGMLATTSDDRYRDGASTSQVNTTRGSSQPAHVSRSGVDTRSAGVYTDHDDAASPFFEEHLGHEGPHLDPHQEVLPLEAPVPVTEPRRRLPRREHIDDTDDDDPYNLGIPAAIKLGLGDFIFYSVLVGRASMYDYLTVYASFIGVISGLGVTLLLLAVMKKALPALPASIALGIIFYFMSRLILEPFVVPPFENMIYW